MDEKERNLENFGVPLLDFDYKWHKGYNLVYNYTFGGCVEYGYSVDKNGKPDYFVMGFCYMGKYCFTNIFGFEILNIY